MPSLDDSKSDCKRFSATPEVDRSLVEQIMRSNPAAAAFGVAVSEVWIWIHGALVSKRGQRRRVLEAFLKAPNHRMTSMELAVIANQYGARVKELRDAGFPIPNLRTHDGGTFFELMITESQVREIRAALAVADVIKPPKNNAKKRPEAVTMPVPPPANTVGQFGFGFGPVKETSSFVDMETGK
jgi:hypothetical protein